MSKCRILFQGDSITDGLRGRNTDPNHILGHGYVFSIASGLGYKYPEKNYEFINKGVSGNTSADLYARWQMDALNLAPDIISLLVGINDTGREIVCEKELLCSRFETTLRLLLAQTLEILPNVDLIIIEPFMLDSGNEEKEKYQKMRQNLKEKQLITRKIANEFDTIYVPLQDRFNKAAKIKPANYWIWDSVHPTYAGHGLIADAWLKDTKSLFDSK